jgi:hypothetical protein
MKKMAGFGVFQILKCIIYSTCWFVKENKQLKNTELGRGSYLGEIHWGPKYIQEYYTNVRSTEKTQ